MKHVRARYGNRRRLNLRFISGMRNKSDMKQEATSMLTFPEPAAAAAGRSGSASLLTGRKRGCGARATALASTVAIAMAMLLAGASTASADPAFDVSLDAYAGEVQVLDVHATAGDFRLRFGTGGPGISETPDISIAALQALPAAQKSVVIQDALNGLGNISAGGGSVSVPLTVTSGVYVIVFDGGSLANTDVPRIEAIAGSTPLTGNAQRVAVRTIWNAGLQHGDRSYEYSVAVKNSGTTATSGTTTVQLDLPDGASPELGLGPGIPFQGAHGSGWQCSGSKAAGVVPARATCTSSTVVAAGGSFPLLRVSSPVAADMAADPLTVATVSGGGAASPASDTLTIDLAPAATFGIAFLEANAFGLNNTPYTEAAGHPFLASLSLSLNLTKDLINRHMSVEHPKTVITKVPRGFIGNPQAVPELCPTMNDVINSTCPPGSAVGEIGVDVTFGEGRQEFVGLFPLPVFAIEPERGTIAQFAFAEMSALGATYTLTARLDPADDNAVVLEAAPLSTSPALRAVNWAIICSYGAKLSSGASQFHGCYEPGEPGANPMPLLTNPSACSLGAPVTKLSMDSWDHPGVFQSAEAIASELTGCDQVPFEPSVSIKPNGSVVDGPSGLDADISFSDGGLVDPDGIAQGHLKKTVVELPAGVSVNPAAATGLAGCSDAQLALGTDTEPSCPDGSKIGTVTATTPLLEETLTGDLVLRTPKSTDPMSGDMLRTALIVRNAERGLLVKLPGTTTADPETGRLTATFDNNPHVPIGDVQVKLKAGNRGVLALPQACGTVETTSLLTPWSDSPVSSTTDTSGVSGDCSFGFAPKLAAGMSTQKARGNGDFSFKFSREDGEQWVDGLTANLPQGLLASVKDVPLCSSSDAAAGSCPAGSRIGTVDGTAGSGTPFVLERKGDAYLTEGYKGCAYGLSVRVPVVAGPFDKSSPEADLGDIVVRQAVCVDPTTAQVTAISDPFPTIWHGIPLRVRSVTVNVDRPSFMLNPSDCTAKTVGARLHSAPGNNADVSVPFQAAGCSALPFKPRIGLRVTGKRQLTTGKHPGIRALVRQNGVREAGIEKTVVRLPKSLALDPNNAQALCEFADGTKPDLENHCPKGSIVGRARAKTPLLKNDLVGNVYFVKNIRIDAKTGNEIRTLPMIIVALRGEIAVNLKGESSTTKAGKLVNTFANVPDAPISQFNLNIKGGRTGIIAVTRTRRAKINLCAGRHIAEADTDGQNGRRHDFNVRMKTPCTKRQTKNAKRAAAKARAGSKRR